MTAREYSRELGNFEKGLKAFALSLTKDQTDALDLYQETAFRAYRKIHQFQKGTNLKAWMMVIMRNLFINAHHKKRRRQVYQTSYSQDYLLDNNNTVVHNSGESNMQYDELIQLIDRVDDYLRIPFLLSYQGYKYEDIAAELEIPVGTVKSRIFMARRRIKEAINKRNLFEMAG